MQSAKQRALYTHNSEVNLSAFIYILFTDYLFTNLLCKDFSPLTRMHSSYFLWIVAFWHSESWLNFKATTPMTQPARVASFGTAHSLESSSTRYRFSHVSVTFTKVICHMVSQ